MNDLVPTNALESAVLNEMETRAAASSVEEKVRKVNAMLLKGEPGNITVDTYSGFTGYKPQSIVDAMNFMFGIGGWGFEELSSEIVSHQTQKGTSSLVVAKVKVWLLGIETFHPAAWGQGRVASGDVGDAKKSAQTDGMKKALSYFSIGNRAYHGLLEGKK